MTPMVWPQDYLGKGGQQRSRHRRPEPPVPAAATSVDSMSDVRQVTATWTSYTTTNTTVWTNWNVVASSTTLAYAPQTAWSGWVINVRPQAYTRVSDEEMEAARQRRHERQEAKERAHRLLVEHLSAEQATDLAGHGYFYVTSNLGNRFLIRMGRAHNVFRLDSEGRRITEFCGHIGLWVPDEDNVLGQKLLIECDEAAFRSIANSVDLRPSFLAAYPLEEAAA